GVSHGSACRVPYLLVPVWAEGSYEALSATGVVSVPEAESENCVVVERPLRSGGCERIWIDRSTLLIRRVVESRRALKPPTEERLDELRALGGLTAERAEGLAVRPV